MTAEAYAHLVEMPAELVELRHSIDNIDAAVLHMLAERFKCTRKVGELKAKLNLAPADPGTGGGPDRATAVPSRERGPRARVRGEVSELPGQGSDPPPRANPRRGQMKKGRPESRPFFRLC